MHQEFDAHDLPGIRRHIHCLVDPRLSVKTLMEDFLQDVAGGVSDVRILPIEGDIVMEGVVPVPEA